MKCEKVCRHKLLSPPWGQLSTFNTPSIQEVCGTCGLESILSLPTSISPFIRVAFISHLVSHQCLSSPWSQKLHKGQPVK